MKRGVILFLCLATFAVAAQTISYWWEGMLRKPDAIQSQAYWIWPGSNIVFTYASNRFIINSTGGGGAVTNVGTNCFTFTAVAPVQVTTSGTPCINVEYSLTGNLLGWNGIATNGYVNGPTVTNALNVYSNGILNVSTQAFQPACANLTAWCGIPTNGYVNGATVTNALNVYSNGILNVATQAFAPFGSTGTPQTNISYVAVTNSPWFGTNGSVNAMSNAFLMGGDGRLVLGTNNKTASAINYAVFGTAVPAKLTVYGDIAVANEVSNTVFMYTQRTNFLQASLNADNGSLVLTNNSAGSWPAALAIVNKSSKQTGAGIKNPTCFYSYGIDSADNGTHDFFIFDQTAGAFVLASDSSQRMGVKLRLPNFQLDVAGDINTTNGQFRMNGQPLTNIVWTNTFLPASNLVVNLSNNVVNIVTNYVQGTVSNGVYGTGWHTNGNTIGSSASFIGTLDNQNFVLKQNSSTCAVFSAVNRVAFGTSSANANNATAFGNQCVASGSGSFSGGGNCTASGPTSFAYGVANTASGQSAFAVGNNCQATDVGSFAAGAGNLAQAEAAVSLGESCQSIGVGSFSFGLAAIANNDGSFVWSDSNISGATDDAPNQFVVGSGGGVFLHTFGRAVRTDGPTYSTNGLYFEAHDNGDTRATGIQTPVHAFCSLSATDGVRHVTLTAVNTYAVITNWNYSVTNAFNVNRTLGYATNLLPGWYRLSFSMSAAGGANDEVEADIATNGVASDIIAAHTSAGSATRNSCASGTGILFLPANTPISLMVKNLDSTTLSNTHSQITIGAP